MSGKELNSDRQITFFGNEKQNDASINDYVNTDDFESSPTAPLTSDAKLKSKVIVSTEAEQEPLPDAEVAPEHTVKPQRVDVTSERIKKTAKKKRKGGFFEANYKKSVILNFILLISNAIGKMFRNSFTVSVFTSFSQCASAFSESFIFGIFGDTKSKKVTTSLKKNFRRSVTGASIPAMVTNFFTSLVRIKTRIYGYLLFAFSTTTLLVYFIISSTLTQISQSPYNPITALIVLVVALVFIIYNKSLSDVTKESWVLSTLLFNFLGIKRPSYTDSDDVNHSASGACIIGAILGALTAIFPAHMIIMVTLTAIYTFIVAKFPETGVISLLIILPFLNVTGLVYISSVLTVSYIFKIFTGKRTPSFEFSDLFIAALLFLIALSEIISFGVTSISLVYTALLLVYFLCVCTLKDSVWFQRAINSILLGTFAYTLYSLFVILLGRTLDINIEFVKQTDLCSYGASVFSSSAVLGVFIMCGIFFVLSAFFTTERKSNKLVFLLLAVIGLVFIFLEASLSVIVALLITLTIFLVLISSKSMIFVVIAAIVIPILPLFYSGVFTGITDLLEEESYRVNIWSAVINMLSKYGFTGIGMSENAFSNIYATYYVGNTTNVPHAHSFMLQCAMALGIPGLILLIAIVFFILQGAFSYGRNTTDKWSKNRLYCYSGMCSVLAMFICGITENIAHNPRIFLLFFVMCAISVCARRSAKDTSDSAQIMLEIDENYNG